MSPAATAAKRDQERLPLLRLLSGSEPAEPAAPAPARALDLKHRRSTQRYQVRIDGAHLELDDQFGQPHRFEVIRQDSNHIELRVGASHETLYVYFDGKQLWVAHKGRVEVLEGFRPPTRDLQGDTRHDSDSLAGTDLQAPMTGRVAHVDVRVGDSVTKGQRLLTLEAMKMELALCAELDGVVASLHCAEGAAVYKDDLLLEIEPSKNELPQ